MNNKRVDIPSYRVSQYDIIDVREKSLQHAAVPDRPRDLRRSSGGPWLQVVPHRLRILVHRVPERAQIDVPLPEQLIVEYYSK